MQQITMAQWAHDIRNALGTVALYVDTLRRPADPHTNDIVMSAHTLLKKAAAMCNDAVSQVQHSERPERAVFDVAEIARQVRDLVRPTLPATVSMRVTASGPVEALANAQDVFRILFNLAHNAAAVARRTGSLRDICIELRRRDHSVAIIVADDGPGLPDAVKARLFRPGHSGSGSSGMGLSIARELAERNGGVLELAERQKGAAFVVELPLHAPARERARPRHTRRQSLQPSLA